MAKAFLYDLYDNGEKVLTAVRAGDIRKYLNSTNLKIQDYLSGNLYRDRYTIRFVGAAPDRVETKVFMPIGFWEEWRRVCERFQEYTWVKRDGPGVYKLVPVKRFNF